MQKATYQGEEGFVYHNQEGHFFLKKGGDSFPVDPDDVEVIPVSPGMVVLVLENVENPYFPETPMRGTALYQWGGMYQWYAEIGGKAVKGIVAPL